MKQHSFRVYVDYEHSIDLEVINAWKRYKGRTVWNYPDKLEAEAKAKEIVLNTGCVVSVFELNMQNSLIDAMKGVPHVYFWKTNGKIKQGAHDDSRLLWRKTRSS